MRITSEEIDSLLLRLRLAAKCDDLQKRTLRACRRAADALDALTVEIDADNACLDAISFSDFDAARAIE